MGPVKDKYITPGTRRKRLTTLVGIILVLWGLCCLVPPKKMEPTAVLHGSHLRIAHRCGQPPEATLYACRRSAPLADILEMDVHLTRDRKVVVIHDATVDRTTDGTGPVNSFTLADIQKLDAGYRYAENDTFPFRGKGIRIQEISDFFEAFPGHRFYIEVKSEEPEAVSLLIAQVRRAGMSSSVILASVREQTMRQIELEAPEIARAASFRESLKWILAAKVGVNGLVSFRSHALALPPAGGSWIITPSFVRRAQDQNIRIHMWTINDAASMQHWRGVGVDGIMTDNIPLLNKTLSE